MEKQIFVYIDMGGQSHLVGNLWSRVRRGRESATFEYVNSWLDSSERFALEPALVLAKGPQHTPANKSIFGALGDSAPDRWGRILIRRAARRCADKEGVLPRSLMEIDYLLAVSDEARQGALRFCLEKDGSFLFDEATTTIPPLIDLPKLLSASQHVVADADTGEDLRLLLAPGSSRQYGANVESDLHALWRRIIFTVLISNTDDHLRNHGFLYVKEKGWTLSPAFDLNPVPLEIKPRVLSTTIGLDDPTASLELAISEMGYFELTKEKAKTIVSEVAQAVSGWRVAAKNLGIPSVEIKRMESAFEHKDLSEALSM